MDEFLKLLNRHGNGSLLYGDWEDFLGEMEDEYEDDDDDEDEDEDEEEIKTVTDFAFVERTPFSAYTVKSIEQHGGQGQGDSIYAVYSVEKSGTELGYVKASGWYASHCGCEFRKAFEVKPVEKMVTVFEPVKQGDDDE